MPPLKIDIIALLPDELSLCNTCTAFLDQVNLVQKSREGRLESYPPEYQREVAALEDLLLKLSQEFGERVLIHLIDPRSLNGLVKVVRHGIRRYPTVMIQEKEKIVGLEWENIKHTVQSIE